MRKILSIAKIDQKEKREQFLTDWHKSQTASIDLDLDKFEDEADSPE